jgi:hypothetical protein
MTVLLLISAALQRLDGNVFGHLDLPHHSHEAVAGARHRGRPTRQDGSGGVLGVEGVALAAQPTVPGCAGRRPSRTRLKKSRSK